MSAVHADVTQDTATDARRFLLSEIDALNDLRSANGVSPERREALRQLAIKAIATATCSMSAAPNSAPADGWIEWVGGECPVALDARVDVRHADDTHTHDVRAGDAIVEDARYGFDWWRHQDVSVYTSGFITAYRVVSA